jgi:PadR family transcriptional regulator, regulatory protein PadR
LESRSSEPDHGYSIAQRIKERSSGMLELEEGTLYPALHKLENEGLAESFEEIENGRTRRYYQLTGSGRGKLAKGREEWEKVSRSVTTILLGAEG